MQNNLTKNDLREIDQALDKAILWYKEWKDLNKSIENTKEDKFLSTYIENRINDLTGLQNKIQANIKWVV